MRRGLALAGTARLAEVQGTLCGEGLREGAAAVALVVVVDVVTEETARSLWTGERIWGGGRGEKTERGD